MRMMNKKDIIGFDKEILGNISDSFAFADPEKNHSFPQSYVSAENDQTVIFTAPEQGIITKEEQKKRIEHIEKERTNQDYQYSDLMKKQQINAVIQTEQENIVNNNMFNTRM